MATTKLLDDNASPTASFIDEKDYKPRDSGETTSTESTDSLRKDYGDLEAQKQPAPPAPPVEHQVSFKSKLLFLGAYFILNLALTLSNKAVLGKARFPWLLTTLHTGATSIGCFVLFGFGSLKLTHLTSRENLTLVAFSFLFTINIAISNVSLAAVSVPFHQIMRSTCPIATIFIYRVVYARTYSNATYLSMIPLILGVALATAGDYYCTLSGFTLTVLGVLLSAIKTVATNRLMTGSLALSAMEVLLRMSPLATIQCVLYAFLTGEVDRFRSAYASGEFSNSFGTALLANAVIAFALNVTSFQTNKVAGALTMTVCGNVKQVLTIGLGIVLFNVKVGWLNALGTVVTIAGAIWYSKVELDAKRSRVGSKP
ncbi:uncharacterized protein LTR77_000915 [Saxophila tyrrhenica]|uniref:Sugar phosphate transporter domain-containing protein n=1 Tax=Saxophila tyrrhenica TaxID=1690608 RepID=A0AAV9PTV3_9PEZI|nr:hypothetical protein LTR77_000915 [Saxophila tyrrhenica]